jgi:hypothetical protein
MTNYSPLLGPLLLNPPFHILPPLAQQDTKPGPSTDPLPIPYKDKRNDTDQAAQPAEQRTRTRDTEAPEHGHACEREDRADGGSGARGSGVGGRGKDSVRVGYVV